jgi:hypothetical protein
MQHKFILELFIMAINEIKGPSTAPVGGWKTSDLPPVPYITPEIAAKKIEDLTKGDSNPEKIREAANFLSSLPPALADATIDTLSKNGTLDHALKQIVDGGGFAGNNSKGLSANDQKTFYANLAKQLDGASLTLVHDSLAKRDKGSDRAQQLVDAIVSHASPGAKTDFVVAMGKRIPPADRDGSGLIQNGTNLLREKGDMEALAVGKILSSMSGSNLDKAIKALGPEGFRSVINMSVVENYVDNKRKMTYDTKVFENLGKAIEGSQDPQTKAMFVEYGGRRLREVRAEACEVLDIDAKNEGPSEKKMMDTIAAVIDKNPTETIRALANLEGAESGTGLASYAQSMLDSGVANRDKLTKQYAQIAYDTKNSSGGLETNKDGQLIFAEPLGYFAGAISAAEKSVNLGNDKRALVDSFISALAALDPTGASEAGLALSNGGLTKLLERGSGDLGRALMFGVMDYDAGKRTTTTEVDVSMRTIANDIIMHAKPELAQRRNIDYN